MNIILLRLVEYVSVRQRHRVFRSVDQKVKQKRKRNAEVQSCI